MSTVKNHQLDSEKQDSQTWTRESSSEEEKNCVDEIPDGGARAWLVVFGVFLSQTCAFGCIYNAYGVYNDFYVREYLVESSTSSQISWIGSVQLFLVLSAGIISGRAFDAGYFYHLMIGASVLFEFCLFMISISQPEQYYQLFLAQGIGMGIAIGLMYIPAIGIISHYFQKRRALAIGLATSGSAVGGAIHPIMLNSWFHGSLGFHSGVKASAGLTGGLMIISLILMKPRYPKNKKKVISTVRSFSLFLHDFPYVIMIIGTALALAGLYYPIFFLQLNSIKNGISPHLAFYTIAILNAASAVGRVIPNLLVYRYGAFNVIIPCVYLASLLVFCTLAIKDVPGTMVFAILYGFFSGAYASVLPAMVSSTAANDSEIGARLGVCFTFTGIGGLIGTPIAGALLSTSFIWWRPTVFSGICVFCAASCFSTARIFLARRRRTQII
ncbi:major facilitator superfamily domain-containing protein [Pholiota molesta]|nr:major facilitator superfamily domain-containing protein [Pholiota molesta]